MLDNGVGTALVAAETSSDENEDKTEYGNYFVEVVPSRDELLADAEKKQRAIFTY